MARVLTLTFLAVLALPAARAAADPLLSGYAGPGGGEQVVLGVPVGGSGGRRRIGRIGRLRRACAPRPRSPGRAPRRRRPAPAGLRARRPGQRPSGGSAPSGRRSSSSRHRGTATGTGTPGHRPRADAAPGAPPVRAYPSRASDAGGLPLSGGDVLLGVLALVALVAAGAGLRLLSDRAATTPQRLKRVPVEVDIPG